jgi:hypothetical protein
MSEEDIKREIKMTNQLLYKVIELLVDIKREIRENGGH